VQVVVSLAWGIVAAIAGYALARAIQSVASPDPDPAAVVWSAHSGYFWRVLTMGYAGGIAAFVALLVARQRCDAASRGLVSAIGVATLLLVLQAALLP
jgi:hypothetical protein